ncbi:MAG: TIGR04283 family arsenosugar biosynthesis glycosyltransferase [Flavobacteriales bacterium]|nr:TIGR04283 family arsenosugar biosynthesis glycosyltransferase [Flavobacteriales bacterium]
MISIIIPVWNEVEMIQRLHDHLLACLGIDECEIIVVDGGSTDGTKELLAHLDVQVFHSAITSRAVQMNLGAKHATKDVLWFVHADTLPPTTFISDIRDGLSKGYKRGGYSFKFESDRLLLRLNSIMTRLNVFSFRGGDQTLYCERDRWDELEGYDEDFVIMEEYDFMKRAGAAGYPHLLMKGDVLVSARKYIHNSYLKVQWVNLQAMRMFHKGVPSEEIKTFYRAHLRQSKAP